MAGLGFKDFQVGEVLTSSDVDGYLMQQAVMRFADSGARGTALGTAVGTAVALAEGMLSYLNDVDKVQVYDGTEWKNVGGIGQVVTDSTTTATTTTSTSFQATQLSLSITPASTSNLILLLVTGTGSVANPARSYEIQLRRGATQIADMRGGITSPAGFTQTGTPHYPAAISLVDSPSTTSATTYDVRVRADSSSTSVSFPASGFTATLTAIEVLA